MYFFTKWKHRYIHLKEKHLIQWFPNTGVRTYSGTSAPSSGMRGILSCTTRGVQFSFFFCFSSYFFSAFVYVTFKKIFYRTLV